MRNKKNEYIVIALIIIVTATRFIFISATTIIDDEAYYFFFSKHLSAGYIDHGPAIAFLIKYSTMLFGDTAFGIRALGIIIFTILGVWIYFFGKRYFNRKTGVVFASILLINIFFHASVIIITPDFPMLVFGLLTISYFYKAYFHNANYFYLAGIFLGIGFLSKISIVFPAFGIFLFPFLASDKRNIRTDYRFYLSFIIALVIYTPFIIWNFNNDWAFFRYQGSHIMQEGGFGDFVGLWIGLSLLVGPVLFYYMLIIPNKTIINIFRNTESQDSTKLYFSLVVFIPLIYFIIQSMFSKLEMNWPAPIIFGGVFIFAIEIGTNWKKKRKLFLIQLAYSIILIAIITIQTYYRVLPMSVTSDPTSRYYEYNCFNNEIKLFLENDSLKKYRIISNNFQIPSMVNFIINPKQEATCLSIGYHNTYYSYLYPDQDLVGKDYIFISKKRTFPKKLEEYFSEITFLKSFSSVRYDHNLKNYSLWLVKDYIGKPKK